MGKSSGLAEKSKNRLRKHQGKHENEREKARDNAIVEISMDAILNLRPEESEQTTPPPVPDSKGRAEAVAQADADSDQDSGVNSEVEEQERRLTEKKRKSKGKAKDQGPIRPFAQRDLVSLAFAGDKVVQVCFPFTRCVEVGVSYSFILMQDFQEVKQRETLEDAPKEVDTTLPGWVRSLSIITALSAPSCPNHSRARGAGAVPKKHHQNRSSSRRSLGSTPGLGRTTGKPTSSSLRNGTKRLPSIWSRTFHTPIQAKRSTRGAYRHRLGRNGIPGSGSRGEHCRGWLRRCVLQLSPISAGSLR